MASGVFSGDLWERILDEWTGSWALISKFPYFEGQPNRHGPTQSRSSGA